MQAEGYGADIAFDGSTLTIMGKGLGKGAHGRTPVVRATVKGSDLRADDAVNVARTSDVPQKWLDSVTN